MSKDIIIQEGGVNKNLNSIKKILTDEQEGGSCNWIPEDEAERGTKTITKNGTYKASDDDLYGYSKVTVNVTGGSGSTPSSSNTPGSSVTGKDPEDEDGNEYSYTVNDDHEVIKTKLPTRIVMSSLPYKTSYENQETIDFTGAEVTAYYEDGGQYGVVPFEEVTFEPLKADKSKTTEDQYTSELDTSPFSKPIMPYSQIVVYHVWVNNALGYCNFVITPNNGEKLVIFKFNDSWTCVWAISNNSNFDVSIIRTSEKTGEITSVAMRQHYMGSSYESFLYDGKRVYGKEIFTAPEESFKAQGYYILEQDGIWTTAKKNTAWTIIYGTMIPGGQTIDVKWKRPADEKELATSFRINVSGTNSGQSQGNTPNEGEESGGGGSHGF